MQEVGILVRLGEPIVCLSVFLLAMARLAVGRGFGFPLMEGRAGVEEPSGDRRLLEDGTSYRLLEDGTSFRLLE